MNMENNDSLCVDNISGKLKKQYRYLIRIKAEVSKVVG